MSSQPDSSSTGLRQRKPAVTAAGNDPSTVQRTRVDGPVPKADEPQRRPDPDDADDDDGSDAPERYGYDGSEDDDPDPEDDASESDEVPLPLAGTYTPPPDDDFLYILSAVVGFVLCAAAASFLPPFGIQSDFVMAGGMVVLLVYIVLINICPQRCFRMGGTADKPEALPAVEGITPQMVFIVAGCLGVMLGGVIGSALVHMHVFG